MRGQLAPFGAHTRAAMHKCCAVDVAARFAPSSAPSSSAVMHMPTHLRWCQARPCMSRPHQSHMRTQRTAHELGSVAKPSVTTSSTSCMPPLHALSQPRTRGDGAQ
eukprot:15440937-Alexandrium_andersonii.AAC.2